MTGEPAWKAKARRLEELVPGETPEEVGDAMERLSPEELVEALEIVAEFRSLRHAWPN